jgi:cardiolipin synthase
MPGDEKIPTQVIASGPNDMYKSENRDMMIRMIMDAKESIYLQTPYFTPDEAFISALKIAALSGKDIRIMVPGKWDKAYVKAAAMEFIREMIPYGIKFYAYPGFIHAKTLVVDGKIVTIGTTNIDTRSFELHFEMNIIFYDATFAQKNVDIFLEDQKKCTLIEKENLDKAPIFKRTLWGFFKLFSPLM